MRRFPQEFISGMAILLLFIVALYMRVELPYDQIFAGKWIKFAGVDAYYHMRIVDTLVRNFPRLIEFDPYSIYPGGHGVGGALFFDWLLAGIILVTGLGSPTQHTVDVVSVYFPAVLGALTVIPVYFLGRGLIGRWGGLLAAAVLVVLPGEFLGRSVLGFTDHHVAEVLFTTTTMLFLVLALKSAQQGHLTFDHLKRRDWKALTKPIVYSSLAGIFLGIYLLTWLGAPLFIFIIFLYFVIQFVVYHFRHQSSDYLCVVGCIFFLVALFTFRPLWDVNAMGWTALVIALLALPVLNGISRLMASRGVSSAYYLVALVAVGLAGLAFLYLKNPDQLRDMLSQFSIFFPSEVARTTMEMQAILRPEGEWSLAIVWGNFTTTIFLSIISLLMVAYLMVRHDDTGKTLLVVWTLVMLAATLAQRRFAYYLVVNVALLSSYFSWLFLELNSFKKQIASLVVWSLVILAAVWAREHFVSYLGFAYYLAVNVTLLLGYFAWLLLHFASFREPAAEPAKIPPVTKTRKGETHQEQQAGLSHTVRYVRVALAVLVVFFLVFFPNLKPAVATARRAAFAPSDAWCRLLEWMQNNTPEPTGDRDFYYHLYQPPPLKKVPPPLFEPYPYPESAYGVMSWWDYGYWITRIAHRFPNTNPSQEPEPIIDTANFLLSQSEDSAEPLIQKLDSAYIILDHTLVTGKLWAIAKWAGKDQSEFYGVYYVPRETRLIPVVCFYPTYYRSLAVRMYNFDGKAVTSDNTTVISYEEKVSREGARYRHLTKAEVFPNWQAAEAYIARQKSPNYRIVSNDPFISPLPLAALQQYKLIHAEGKVGIGGRETIVPEVKVFEYLGRGKPKR